MTTNMIFVAQKHPRHRANEEACAGVRRGRMEVEPWRMVPWEVDGDRRCCEGVEMRGPNRQEVAKYKGFRRQGEGLCLYFIVGWCGWLDGAWIGPNVYRLFDWALYRLNFYIYGNWKFWIWGCSAGNWPSVSISVSVRKFHFRSTQFLLCFCTFTPFLFFPNIRSVCSIFSAT